MSAIAANIAIGLVTSLISGFSVWTWGKASVTRRQRERARFFRLPPGGTCRIVAPEAHGAPRTVAKHDVLSIIELAKLARDLKADLDVVSSGEGTHGVGDLTEFCVGGPTANVRARSHLARFLPGVTFLPHEPGNPQSMAIAIRGQKFLREPDSREYVLLARIIVPGGAHPLFLACGQTSITNRAAVSYLRDNYRRVASGYGPDQSWCVILRVIAPSVYGHQLTELAADVTAAAFSSPGA